MIPKIRKKRSVTMVTFIIFGIALNRAETAILSP